MEYSHAEDLPSASLSFLHFFLPARFPVLILFFFNSLCVAMREEQGQDGCP
jgi:hypothetical protein